MLVLGDQHDAEDVAQDAYLKAYRSWARFDGVDVRAWLYTIALRLAFNQLRGRRRWLAAIGRIEQRPWSDPSDPDLAAALATLDVRTRTALLLNVVDGYTQAEIAPDAVRPGRDRRELDLTRPRDAPPGARSGSLSPGLTRLSTASSSGSANWLSYRST